MVVSLYVCDIPQNIERDELEGVFSCYDGFIDSRIARDKNKYANLFVNRLFRQKIAFVDFHNEETARKAMDVLKGFRFPHATRGISIYYSYNQ